MPRALPARFVPPSGFGYPLDGLLPSIPRRFFFAPAALMGFSLRSQPAAEGTPAFPPGCAHLPFLPRNNPPPKAGGRLRRPRFLGFNPPGRPVTPGMCLAHRKLATPLGFALLGFAREGLGRDFAPPPLTRFYELAMNASTARRPRVSIGLRLALLTARRASTHGQDQGNPYRVSAPSQSLIAFEPRPDPGYGFTSHRVAHYCRPTGDPRIGHPALPELPGLNSGAWRSRLWRRNPNLIHVLPPGKWISRPADNSQAGLRDLRARPVR